MSPASHRRSLIRCGPSSSVIHFSRTRLRAALLSRHRRRRACRLDELLGGSVRGDSRCTTPSATPVDAGLMLVAAAGNGWPFVAHPARYDEVIAAGGMQRRQAAVGRLGKREAVDITALGESVWRARIQKRRHIRTRRSQLGDVVRRRACRWIGALCSRTTGAQTW